MTYSPRTLARAICPRGGLYVGAPVAAAAQWSEYATAANWTRGKGACLVPYTVINTTIAAGNTRTFRFRTKTRNVAVERIWCFAISTTTIGEAATATLKAPASTGTAMTVYPPFVQTSAPTVTYIETVASKTTAEAEITCDIAASGKTITVHAIACYEQDRAALNSDTTDYGVMIDTVRAGQPIFALENHSAYSVQRALANLDARRVGLYHFAVPTEVPITRVSATPQAVLAIGHPVRTQLLNSAATTGSVHWSVYAKMSAGTGTVAIATSGSGVSDSVSVTGASFAWTTARAVSIYCDDFDEADGNQGGAFDLLTWTIAGDGTNTLSVATLSIWVPDAA